MARANTSQVDFVLFFVFLRGCGNTTSHPGRPQRGPNANNVGTHYKIVVDTMARSHTRAWKQHHNPGQQQWLIQQNTGRTLSTDIKHVQTKQTATQTGGTQNHHPGRRTVQIPQQARWQQTGHRPQNLHG